MFQIGGFSAQDPTPSFSITIPRLLSYMATGSFSGKVDGIDEIQRQERHLFGRGNYVPNVEVDYWSMRVMAYLGMLLFLIAAVGAWLYRRRKLARARWFQWTAIVAIAFPYIAATSGWILTEMGRQPWIVQGLLKTDEANSPNVSTTWLGISLGVFVALYVLLGVTDFVLMRRYARPGEPEAPEGMPAPAVTY
jgi:cytochrome d ubiquinol oxidase subunit I